MNAEGVGDGGVEDENTASHPEQCEADGGVEDKNIASPPEQCEANGGVEDDNTASPPEQCEALASAIAGVLGGALREHEEQVTATAQSQDGVVAAIDRLNGELDKLLENAPSLIKAKSHEWKERHMRRLKRST